MKRFVLPLLAIISTAAFAQEDKPIISINGESIMRSTYVKRMEVLPGVGKQVAGRFIEETPGFLTLQSLINETLVIQLAAQRGVTPSEAQITEEIDSRTKENPNYVKAFTMLGFTMGELRYDVKVQLSEFNVITQGITIADAQVNRYYQDRKADFTLPKRFRLRVIAVNSDELKKKVDAALASGKKFEEVAAEHSIDISTKYDGGLMGEIPEDSLGGEVKTLVVGLKKGQTTSWLKSPNSEVKIFVDEILPAKETPLDDTLRRKIRNKLMIDRGNVRNDFQKLMEEMRSKAKVQYTGTPFDERLKDLLGQG
jgi:parvulin-like peptidyl-prolyl isomerase